MRDNMVASWRAQRGVERRTDQAVDAPHALSAESNASEPKKFPNPTIDAPMRALIGRILQEQPQLQGQLQQDL